MDIKDLSMNLNDMNVTVTKGMLLEGCKKMLGDQKLEYLKGIQFKVKVIDGVAHLIIDLQMEGKGLDGLDMVVNDGDEINAGKILATFTSALNNLFK